MAIFKMHSKDNLNFMKKKNHFTNFQLTKHVDIFCMKLNLKINQILGMEIFFF